MWRVSLCQRRPISRGHLETRLEGHTRARTTKAKMQNMAPRWIWGGSLKMQNKDVERCLDAEKSL